MDSTIRIIDLKPEELRPELRLRVERVMRRKKLTWTRTLDYLARKVISPTRRSRSRTAKKRGRKVVAPDART